MAHPSVQASASRSGPGLFAGFSYPFRGARFVFREHPSLAKFWIPPLLITLVALVGAGYLATEWRGELLATVWEPPAGEDVWAQIAVFFHSLLSWLLALLMFLLLAVMVILLANVIAAPFNDLLSEAVERLQSGFEGPRLSLRVIVRDLARTVGMESLKLLLYVTVIVPLWLLSWLLPVVGPALYTVCAFGLTAMYFALDYTDWPASRHDWPVGRRFSSFFGNFGAMLGFGIGVWVILFIPLVNLALMPAAVAGGTLLHIDLQDAKNATVQGGYQEG